MPASAHRSLEPDPIETRLVVVAEMLDRAVTELNRVVADIKSHHPPQSTKDAADQEQS
jgi:hypothetical protein